MKRPSPTSGFTALLLVVRAAMASSAPAPEPNQAPRAKLVFSSRSVFRYNPLALEEQLRVAYRHRLGDATLDLLTPTRGYSLSDHLDLVYLHRDTLIAGVRYYAAMSFDGPWRAAAGGDDANAWQRVGPLVRYTFPSRPSDILSKLTLGVNAGWYVSHRYRAGREVSRAIPSVLAEISFQSEPWARQ